MFIIGCIVSLVLIDGGKYECLLSNGDIIVAVDMWFMVGCRWEKMGNGLVTLSSAAGF